MVGAPQGVILASLQNRGFPDLQHPVAPQFPPLNPLPGHAALRRRVVKYKYSKPRRIVGAELGPRELEIANVANDAWVHGIRYKRLLGRGGMGLVALCEIRRGALRYPLVVKVNLRPAAASLRRERGLLKAWLPLRSRRDEDPGRELTLGRRISAGPDTRCSGT